MPYNADYAEVRSAYRKRLSILNPLSHISMFDTYHNVSVLLVRMNEIIRA